MHRWGAALGLAAVAMGNAARADAVSSPSLAATAGSQAWDSSTLRSAEPAARRSPRLRYEGGSAPPPGYHFESNPRKGLIVAGALTFGVPYLLSLMVAAVSTNEADRWLYVPVTGPIGALARGRGSCSLESNGDCAEKALVVVGLAFDLAAQTAGALLFTMAYVFPKKEWVSDFEVARRAPPGTTWSVRPRIDREGRVGVTVTATVF